MRWCPADGDIFDLDRRLWLTVGARGDSDSSTIPELCFGDGAVLLEVAVCRTLQCFRSRSKFFMLDGRQFGGLDGA